MIIGLVAIPNALEAHGEAPITVIDSPSCHYQDADHAVCMSLRREYVQNGSPLITSDSQSFQNIVSNSVSSPTMQSSGATPNASPPANISLTASGLRTAYGLTSMGDPTKVVVLIDAYNDPAVYTNLTTYRKQNNLPTMDNCSLTQLNALTTTSRKPCFSLVNQDMNASPLPTFNAYYDWNPEEDLDVQSAAAVCPMCSLIVVEATNNGWDNMGIATLNAAHLPRVNAISNSYGTLGAESTDPDAMYPYWNTAGQLVPTYAASGDWAYQPTASYPAGSSHVIAVGGTKLILDRRGVRSNEVAWSYVLNQANQANGSGSGCANWNPQWAYQYGPNTYNPAPEWENIPGSPCGPAKASADLSAVADPSTGLSIYSDHSGPNNTIVYGWMTFGGTSMSSPIIAALQAAQGGYDGASLARLYAGTSATTLFDITSGNTSATGTCTPIAQCKSGVGWDGPTGLGSINAKLNATSWMSAPKLSAITVTGLISGSPKVSNPITATATATGIPTPTLSYQWATATSRFAPFTNITGANASSYSPTPSDVGKILRVTVTAQNPAGTTTSSNTFTAKVVA